MESGELQYLRQHAGAAVRLLDDLSYECRDTARANIREVATLAQGIVVLGSVGHLVFWLGELVAAVLAVFVGHLLFLSMKSIRIMPVRLNCAGIPIYATTPRRHARATARVMPRRITSAMPAFKTAGKIDAKIAVRLT